MLWTMSDAILAAASVEALEVKRFKVRRLTYFDGHIDVFEQRTDFRDSSEANVVLTAKVGNRSIQAELMVDETSPVTRRLPNYTYDIQSFESDGRFSGRADIGPRDAKELLTHLTEVNKRIVICGMKASLPNPFVEMVELENLSYGPAIEEFSGQVEVKNLSTRKVAGRMYILNELKYRDSNGTSRRSRFNFSARDRS